MIDFTPNPVALAVGPLEVRWYGIGYVTAIIAGTWLATREARRRGERTDVIVDGLIFVAIAALIGGRAYHVIDQWAYYQNHVAQIFLPPYSGLGIYGGLLTGMLAVFWYARRHHLSFWRWGDILAPSILIAQAVGRWGNFMNQELYGPPRTCRGESRSSASTGSRSSRARRARIRTRRLGSISSRSSSTSRCSASWACS
jgi:phosphatidylglycerol---prolipoprotein diacylglyceryl transferase